MQTKPSSTAAELRSRAEARLKEQPPEGAPAQANADAQRLVHELQVHQIELEMQNEELRQSAVELADRSAKLLAINKELDHFNKAMVGRELRMIELKKEINDLCRQAGLPPRYPADWEKKP